MLVFSELIDKVNSKGGAIWNSGVAEWKLRSWDVCGPNQSVRDKTIKLFVMYLYDPVYISWEIWLFSRREI